MRLRLKLLSQSQNAVLEIVRRDNPLLWRRLLSLHPRLRLAVLLEDEGSVKEEINSLDWVGQPRLPTPDRVEPGWELL